MEDGTIFIEDGTGSGRKAGVTQDHLLKVLAYTFNFEHYINHSLRDSYNIVFNRTPSPNGTFLYIKNTNDKDLTVTDLKIYCDTTEVIEIVLGSTGTPVGGTTNTPVNKTSGVANTADCTCLEGDNITGLSGGNIVDRIVCVGNCGSQLFEWDAALMVPKNTTITLNIMNSSGSEVFGTLGIYFHSLQQHD